jgi:hypothetical protein
MPEASAVKYVLCNRIGDHSTGTPTGHIRDGLTDRSYRRIRTGAVRSARLGRSAVASRYDRKCICESCNGVFRPHVGNFDIEPDSFRTMLQEIAVAEQVERWKLQFISMQPGREGDVRTYPCGFT